MNGEKHYEEPRRVESVSMKFDAFIKKAIRGRIKNAVRDYIKQMEGFPLGQEDEIENVPAPLETDPMSHRRFRVREDDIYLRDERLADAIESMEKRIRDILLLSEFMGYSPDEIGTIMHLSRETVLKYKRLAEKYLEELLRRRWYE